MYTPKRVTKKDDKRSRRTEERKRRRREEDKRPRGTRGEEKEKGHKHAADDALPTLVGPLPVRV